MSRISNVQTRTQILIVTRFVVEIVLFSKGPYLFTDKYGHTKIGAALNNVLEKK